MSTPTGNQDENFMARLRETFQTEAREHIHTISSTLLDMEKVPADNLPADAIERAYRSVHSLKGAARSVGLREIETICQAMESVFHDWKLRKSKPTHRAFDTLHHAVDTLTSLLTGPDPAHGSARAHDELVHRLETISHAKPVGSAQPAGKPAPPPVARLTPTPTPAVIPVPTSSPEPAQQTVRIPVAKLDARLLQAEGMLSIKNAAIQQVADLQEAAAQFEQWQTRWLQIASQARALQQASQRQSISATATQVPASDQVLAFLEWNHDFVRNIHDRLLVLTHNAARDTHNTARSVDDLLQESKDLLMLPFQTIADVFPKVVRDLCSDQGKEARLSIHGADIQIDKRILEETKDLFIHILRNCVDHAVETPAARSLSGKPSFATITLTVGRTGSGSVLITLTDDGKGINTQALKQSAIRLGHISQAHAQTLSDRDAFDLMFISGTSTSPQITSISGRGLGMAIVYAKILALGGRINVQSKPGEGTIFEIHLPSTLSTFRGILVKAGHASYLISATQVQRVTRIKPSQIQSVENRQSITLDGKPVALARLEGALGLAPKPLAVGDHSLLSVIVVAAGQQQIAFLVDEILHEEEVLVKPLPKPLISVRNVTGAAVTRSGAVALVLDAPGLLSSAHTWARPMESIALQDAPPETIFKRVLVVEDSITSRMLIKSILEGAGYKVRTAVDGVDAFTILREELFDLVVSDIEMPRMTGLDLTARIRSQPRYENLPVILVTALESQDQRERGIDAGANAYIVKSSFDQSNLLQVVKRFI
jgi:two-component system, chemotaxis family, sensor kinase CheA